MQRKFSPTHVAFLRGLNVGGHRVKMDVLRALFESLGLTAVSTMLASGNVIFCTETPANDEARIAEALQVTLGYPVQTFIRSLDHLLDVAEITSTMNQHAIFVHHQPTDEMTADLSSLNGDKDRFNVHDRLVMWETTAGMTQSCVKLKDIERALHRVHYTMRNMNTVRRIVAKHRP